jgi:hypothetical protein
MKQKTNSTVSYNETEDQLNSKLFIANETEDQLNSKLFIANKHRLINNKTKVLSLQQ